MFSLKNNKGTPTDEKIPTRGEVLELVKGQCKLLVEMKCGQHSITLHHNHYRELPRLLQDELLKHENWVDLVWIQSFHDRYLQECRTLSPEVVLHKLQAAHLNLVVRAVWADLDGFSLGGRVR